MPVNEPPPHPQYVTATQLIELDTQFHQAFDVLFPPTPPAPPHPPPQANAAKQSHQALHCQAVPVPPFVGVAQLLLQPHPLHQFHGVVSGFPPPPHHQNAVRESNTEFCQFRLTQFHPAEPPIPPLPTVTVLAQGVIEYVASYKTQPAPHHPH